MKNYKTSCISMEVLLWESELMPKPALHLKTFEPSEGDLALVDNVEYRFANGSWAKV